jgi:DNA-binding FadR family transcriptional regulator
MAITFHQDILDHAQNNVRINAYDSIKKIFFEIQMSASILTGMYFLV